MEANPCSSYVELFCLSSFPILDFGPELPNRVPQVHIHNYNEINLYINSPTLLTDFLVVLSTSALVIQDLLPLFSRAATAGLTSEPDFSFSELKFTKRDIAAINT